MSNFWESVKDKSPIIMAVIAGIFGTAAIGTAIHDTLKAVEKCPDSDQEIPRGEIFRKVAPCYIPTAAMWTLSVACLASSAAISSNQKASLVGAYVMVNKAYTDYIAKNKELYGEEHHTHIVREVAKDRYTRTAHPHEEDTRLYYEGYYGEYFESTPEKLLNAEYELNHLLMQNEMVTLGEFFELLGLPQTEASDLGWSTWAMFEWQDHPWIEIRHDPVMMDDGLECEILEFIVPPVPNYADD